MPLRDRVSMIPSFLGDTRGAVAVIFGLVLLPLLLIAGGTVDFSNISRQKSALTQAADAGVLRALRVAREQLKQGKSDWQFVAETQGANFFSNRVRQISGVSTAVGTVKLAVAGDALTGTLNYSVDAPTSILKLVGMKTINLKGSSSSTMGAAQFIDIHFVIDVSASMGIGATKADQQTMQNAIGCAFACHHPLVEAPLWNDNLAAVRATGATLRIDVVRKAVVDALAKLPKDGSARVAIHTFSNSLETVFPLSSNLAGAIAAAQAIDLTNGNKQGGSNFKYSLSQLSNMLASAGNGLTAGQPKGFVLLATDVVENSNIVQYNDGVAPPFVRVPVDPNFSAGKTYWANDLYVQAPDPANCSPIKAKGYTMMTLETAYLIPEGVSNPTFDAIRGDMGPAMTKSMTECASTPGNYYHAESPAEINQAISAMVGSTANLRLTH